MGVPTLQLPQQILENSPSKQNGISPFLELQHRIFGCNLIVHGGILLNLPQNVICTAQTIFHRFYYRRSLTEFSAFETAMTCLALGAKIEECSPPLKYILRTYVRIFRERNPKQAHLANVGSRLYMRWRELLHSRETVILKELGFCLYNIMDHPHKFILFFCQMFRQNNAKLDHEFAQLSWNILNDSMTLDFCVRYQAKSVAAAAIYLAASKLNLVLPMKPAWWTLLNVEPKEILSIVACFQAYYKLPKIEWLERLDVEAEIQDSQVPENEQKVIESTTLETRDDHSNTNDTKNSSDARGKAYSSKTRGNRSRNRRRESRYSRRSSSRSTRKRRSSERRNSRSRRRRRRRSRSR